MQLVRLEIRNFKRVEAVELRFDGAGLVPISGRNANGKTSILDSVAWAVGGPRAIPATEQPVRHGAERALVIAETDEFVIRRTATPEGKQRVTVSAKDGTTHAAPQRLLDKIYSELTWDASAFARMSPKEQRERWIEALGLGEQLSTLETEREAVYGERRDANRDVRQIEAQLGALEEPGPFTPDEEVSAAEVLREISEANALVATNAEQRLELSRADSDHSQATADLERIKGELRSAELRHQETLKRKRRLEEVVETLVEPNLERLQQRLASVESDNREARAGKAYRETATRLEDARTTAAGLDRRVADLEAKKHELLSGAELPVAGLTLTDDGLLYNGVPFSQASTSEQIRVSVAVAIALEPELRCLRISEGSLLDGATREAIDALAREHEFLVLVEVVSDVPTGAPGEIYIEAGEVLVEPAVRSGTTPSGIPWVEEQLFGDTSPEVLDDVLPRAEPEAAPTEHGLIAGLGVGETRVVEVLGPLFGEGRGDER